MKKEKIIEITYSFDDLSILGVRGSDVYLKGLYGFKNVCIIEISKTLFTKSLDLWLEDKKRYCELWGHFCGIMGSIRSFDYEKMDDMNFDGQKIKWYRINSIVDFTDMEHG